MSFLSPVQVRFNVTGLRCHLRSQISMEQNWTEICPNQFIKTGPRVYLHSRLFPQILDCSCSPCSPCCPSCSCPPQPPCCCSHPPPQFPQLHFCHKAEVHLLTLCHQTSLFCHKNPCLSSNWRLIQVPPGVCDHPHRGRRQSRNRWRHHTLSDRAHFPCSCHR